jgi:hypothetical protein
MSVSAPFAPMGSLTLITGSAAPGPTPIRLTEATPGPNNVEVINTAAVIAFLVWGSTAAEAAANAAAVPTVGNPKVKMLLLPPGSDKIYSLDPNAFYTVVGVADVYLVAGDGQ